jgi:hypothetical protein
MPISMSGFSKNHIVFFKKFKGAYEAQDVLQKKNHNISSHHYPAKWRTKKKRRRQYADC